MKLTIRDYRPGDRAHFARCLDEMQDWMVALDPWRRVARTPAHSAKYVPYLLQQARRHEGFVLIAEVDGRRVGAAVGWVRPFTPAEQASEVPTRLGFLSDISVLPGWRGRGIGSRLLQEVEDRFRRAGCDQTSLGVFFPNRAARRLYRRRGYSIRGMFLAKRLAPPPKRWPPVRRASGRYRKTPARGRKPVGGRRPQHGHRSARTAARRRERR